MVAQHRENAQRRVQPLQLARQSLEILKVGQAIHQITGQDNQIWLELECRIDPTPNVFSPMPKPEMQIGELNQPERFFQTTQNHFVL